MITWKKYRSVTELNWIGRKVKTLRELQNGNVVIPKGFVLVISRKYSGFGLEAVETCDKCGIGRKINITRVEPVALELVE